MRNIKKGFSLVELMIVVAIIGILAAIAIPNFMAMQLKAKRAEVPGNVDGIKTSEMAYDAAFDTYIAASTTPATLPGKAQVEWPAAGETGFNSIGWKPDGKVRGQYGVTVPTLNDIVVTGTADVDGDAAVSIYTATTSLNATQSTANDIY